MESNLEKYYFDLMSDKLVIKTEPFGYNFQSKVILPSKTVYATASTEEESRQLAISKAVDKLKSGEVVYGNKHTGEKGVKYEAGGVEGDYVMLEKVFYEEKAQYHIENRLFRCMVYLTEALNKNSREAKRHILERKKELKRESKLAKDALKKLDTCKLEQHKKNAVGLFNSDRLEMTSVLFRNFCSAFRHAREQKYSHMTAAILVLDENGRIEIDGTRYSVIL